MAGISKHPGRRALKNMARTRSLTEMARHYGVDRSTMRRWLRAGNIEPVSGYRPERPSLERIQHAREVEDLTLEEIGQRYGVSRQRVHQWIQEWQR